MKIMYVFLAFLLIGTAQAAGSAYGDVQSGVWYEEAVQSMLENGLLDKTQSQFRGDATATRAELVKLIVEANGGILSKQDDQITFDDVPVNAWYHSYFAEAKKEKWVTGDSECATTEDRPCNARPNAPVSRAEAMALIVRSFGLQSNGDIADFKDNPKGSWFYEIVQAAADNCVVWGTPSAYVRSQGAARGLVRPLDILNRAEMVVMIHRVDTQFSGTGPACETR